MTALAEYASLGKSVLVALHFSHPTDVAFILTSVTDDKQQKNDAAINCNSETPSATSITQMSPLLVLLLPPVPPQYTWLAFPVPPQQQEQHLQLQGPW